MERGRGVRGRVGSGGTLLLTHCCSRTHRSLTHTGHERTQVLGRTGAHVGAKLGSHRAQIRADLADAPPRECPHSHSSRSESRASRSAMNFVQVVRGCPWGGEDREEEGLVHGVIDDKTGDITRLHRQSAYAESRAAPGKYERADTAPV